MNRDSAHRYLICYDVVSDPRRERLANVLQTYGDRIQYSVFLVDAKPAKLLRLRATIRRTIDPHTDSILICSLGPLRDSGTSRIEFIGCKRALTSHSELVV